ncbi:CDP-alcohol phosphatidyltransferase family protein [Candidatus Poribacteria bacterium]|nr:CDP-alcohol phosphatidyltransferase family protein [Candidatus Poribacteria bacterium]
MISMYKIKPKFQQLVKPLLRIFYKVGFTANGITWLAILLSFTIGILFWFYPSGHMLWIFSVGLLIRMGLNALDGMMAKEYDMTSQGGEILNELGDVLSDAALYLPLIKLTGVYSWLVLLFVFLSTLNEYIGILTKAATGTRRYDGPMGKSDRATILGLSCLIFFFWQPIMTAFNYIFAIMCLLLLLSSAIRLKNGLSDDGS